MLEKHVPSIKSGCESELDGLQCTQQQVPNRGSYLSKRGFARQTWIFQDLKNHVILWTQTPAKRCLLKLVACSSPCHCQCCFCHRSLLFCLSSSSSVISLLPLEMLVVWHLALLPCSISMYGLVCCCSCCKQNFLRFHCSFNLFGHRALF